MSTNEIKDSILTATVKLSCTSKLIISTSGRISSLKRYNKLLQDLLHQDIVYICIHSNDISNPIILPEKFSNTLRSMPCIGGAISKDIKHTIIPFLDFLSDDAREIQSVNTVIVRNNLLYGYNTDIIGFRKAILSSIKDISSVRSAVCYGYGGVVSVVVQVLQSLSVDVYLIGRDNEKAMKRSAELKVKVWDSSCKCDLFVNAAPVTDKPLTESINFLESIQGCSIVFDHEMPGKYLQEYCLNNNIQHIPGTTMYMPQMIAQWSLFLEDLNLSNSQLETYLIESSQ